MTYCLVTQCLSILNNEAVVLLRLVQVAIILLAINDNSQNACKEKVVIFLEALFNDLRDVRCLISFK
jgi:hypothetical protein